MKIRTCAIQRPTKHNGKARNKNTTWSRATSHEWIYARVPARASKMANRCTNTAATRILYLREEPFYEKKLVLNQAIAALRPSVGLPGRFATVWKNRTGHTHTPTHTHTHNYCNPAVHVRRGLIRNINVDCHSHRHWGASPFHLPYWLQCSVFTPTSV